ncbi:hypothetical protein J1N35_011781 [Gossypium stocksii]|uniref:Uncharacterized protein n=1 Tax=Gossypium stocksii TaxID=47602 RepID=A0A9D4ADP7_9ROSI|nr:hypothetical protein J1N35_011781 [Gossypium stocksii]
MTFECEERPLLSAFQNPVEEGCKLGPIVSRGQSRKKIKEPKEEITTPGPTV